MNKLKKLVLIIPLVIMINLIGTVYGASIGCNISFQTDKTEYKKGEEFTVNVYISNIQSDKGVLYLSTILEYDKTNLRLVKMEGKNSWETPTEGSSYNPGQGKIVIGRNALGKANEIVFSMTFLVEKDAKETTSILLKDTQIANGLEDPTSIALVEKHLTIKEDLPDTGDGDNDNDDNDDNDNNNGDGDNDNDDNDNDNGDNDNNNDNDSNNGNNNNNNGDNDNNNNDSNDNNDNGNDNNNNNNDNDSNDNNNNGNNSDNEQQGGNNGTPDSNDKNDATQNGSNSGNSQQNTSGNLTDNTIKDGKLPETGKNHTILIILIAIILITLFYTILRQHNRYRNNKK